MHVEHNKTQNYVLGFIVLKFFDIVNIYQNQHVVIRLVKKFDQEKLKGHISFEKCGMHFML